MNVNEMSRGRMPMVRVLPKATRAFLESADTSSFAANSKIRRTVDIAPRVAPKVKVATVIVVVTVEIIASPFSAFRNLSMHYTSLLMIYIRFTEGATRKRTMFVIPCDSETPIILPVLSAVKP